MRLLSSSRAPGKTTFAISKCGNRHATRVESAQWLVLHPHGSPTSGVGGHLEGDRQHRHRLPPRGHSSPHGGVTTGRQAYCQTRASHTYQSS